MELTVTRATNRDRDAVAALDRLVHGDASRQDYVFQRIKAGEGIVAREGGRVVGFAVADTSFYDQGFVWMLIVHPEDRRRGIGSALMRFVEAHCPTEKLFTSTNQSNVAMQQLCEALGYVCSGIIENLDEGDPEIVYCKRLK